MLEELDRSQAEGLRLLYDLMRRVNSSTDTTEVLEEITRCVTEGLGYGIAAISRLEGDTLVTTAFAGPEDQREFIMGRRRPVKLILDEYEQGDEWGILRYIPHGRVSEEFLEGMWIPDYEPSTDPEAWHPEDALYAPLYSATGELLGNMAVDLPPGGRIPGRRDRELLEMFVVQAGLAMSNAQSRARLAEQVRLGEMIKQVALAGNLVDLDLVLDEAVSAVADGLEGIQTSIRCFAESSSGGVEHSAGHPAPNPVDDGIPSLRPDLERLVAARHTEPVVVRADDADCELMPASFARVQASLACHHGSSLAVAPMRVGMEVLGYVVVLRADDGPDFTRSELGALAEVGRELGQMVLNSRLRTTEQRLVSELQELDRYKGELIATISHELKTPLTSIMGHTELLEDGAALQKSLEAITRNARRLQGLIDNLLSYSKVQEQRASTLRRVELSGLVHSSLDMLSVQAERANVKVVLDLAEEGIFALGDPEELRRVVDNICSNAVKYSRAGGEVQVRVSTHDGYGVVAVTDDGLGISVQDQAHLFSAFHRSSNPEALSIPGTGLGLAISRRIIELHGGRIEVDSTLGQGSTFTVRLPLAGDEPED